MSTGMRKGKLWSTATLVYVGIAAAIALGMILLTGLSDGGERAEFWQTLLFRFSTMFLFTGVLILIIAGTGLFQVYFSVLLSLGSTRKEIVRTFFLSQGATALLTSLLAGLAWETGRYMGHNPLQNELFGIGLPWFLMAAFGIQLLGAAFGAALGAVILRWKAVGAVILMLLCGLIGCAVGWEIAIALDCAETGLLPGQAGTGQLVPAVCAGVLAAGLVFDLCAAAFARFLTRNAEVRA